MPTAARNDDDDALGDLFQKMVMTPEWRQRVKDAMKARGLDQQAVADQLTKHLRALGRPLKKPIHRATVNKVLKGTGHSTKWVQPLCEVLGISPPSVPLKDSLEESYLDDMRTLRALDRDEADRLIGEVRKAATRAARQGGKNR